MKEELILAYGSKGIRVHDGRVEARKIIEQ